MLYADITIAAIEWGRSHEDRQGLPAGYEYENGFLTASPDGVVIYVSGNN